MQSWGKATLYPPRLDKPCELGLEKTGKTRVVVRGGGPSTGPRLGWPGPSRRTQAPGIWGGCSRAWSRGGMDRSDGLGVVLCERFRSLMRCWTCCKATQGPWWCDSTPCPGTKWARLV